MTQTVVEDEDPKIWVSKLVAELNCAGPSMLAEILENAWQKFQTFDDQTQADLFVFLLGQVG